MEKALQKGISYLEEMGYITFNEKFNKEMAWTFIMHEINQLKFREVQEFIHGQ